MKYKVVNVFTSCECVDNFVIVKYNKIVNISLTNNKTCCFIGHRKINITKEQEQKLKTIIEDLIIQNNVFTFLFGSKSEFDFLCHTIVSELKQKYQNIKRIKYTCKSESCLLENEKEKLEKTISNLENQKITLLGYEKEIEHKSKYLSGKASYIERNKAMIDDSDFCMFYYDKNYKPQTRKHKSSDMFEYQPNSGTALSFEYAKQKKKKLINLLQL